MTYHVCLTTPLTWPRETEKLDSDVEYGELWCFKFIRGWQIAHLKFAVRDEKRARVPEVSRLGAAVLILQEQALEDLPPRRVELPHVSPHVLVLVETVDDGVELEGDSKVVAHIPHSKQVLDVLRSLEIGTANLFISGLHKGVAADAEDIQVPSILLEPLLCDEAAVRDDGGVHPELFLAELHHVPEEFLLEERLSPGKVDLVHAPLAQHAKAPLRLLLCQAVRGLGGVEAEAAGVVALPSDVVVHAQAFWHKVLDPSGKRQFPLESRQHCNWQWQSSFCRQHIPLCHKMYGSEDGGEQEHN